MIKEEEYDELLYKAGRTVAKIDMFIDTIIETGLFPKGKIKKIQDYLRHKLMTEDALQISQEYANRVRYIEDAIKKDTKNDTHND